LWDDCISMKIMKKHKIAEANSCSKYSLWVVYAGLAKKHDTFAKTISEIKKIKEDIEK
jgi:hypothetical protein